MTTITLDPNTTNEFVFWSDATIWSPQIVPDGDDVDVVAPTITQDGVIQYYELEVRDDAFAIRSLSLAASNRLTVYSALTVSGDLTADSNIYVTGTLDVGSLEADDGLIGSGVVDVSAAATATSIVGNGLSFTAGNLSAAELKAYGGRLTIDVAPGGFSNFQDGVLTGGLYEANGGGTVSGGTLLEMHVGGLLTTLDATMVIDDGFIYFTDSSGLREEVSQSLQNIAVGGVLDLIGGFGVTPHYGALDVAGQIQLDGYISFSATSLHIENGGLLTSVLQDAGSGAATVNASIVNDGIISVQPAATLALKGTVTGDGYFEIVSPPDTGPFVEPPVLELYGSQSQDVIFTGNDGILALEGASRLTGRIATLGVPDGSSFAISIESLNYDQVKGFSYVGTASAGSLIISTTSGNYSLQFLGDFTAADFKLLGSAKEPTWVQVTPHLASGPALIGTASKEIYLGASAINPFSEVKVAALDTLTATVRLYGSNAGALSLSNAGSGLDSFSYDAATGAMTMQGDATAVTSALEALVFTPSFAGVAAGFARPTELVLNVSNGAVSTQATTHIADYNGVSVAAALGGQTDGFTAICDSATHLETLTRTQIFQLASEGITRLVSDDATVNYSATQSASILTSHMSLGAPANDSAIEHFPAETVSFNFNAAGFLASRVVTPSG